MNSIVSIDIETTGLDSIRDAIIEVAAIRINLNNHRIEDEWHTLINPGRPIPRQITQLTNITNAMVQYAPRLQEIGDEFENFVGDSIVLGHNVRFDLEFLQQRGLLLQVFDRIDTYDLAAVLRPGAGRYNLGALAEALYIPLPATHRALDDARATHAVFHELYQELLALPLELIAEIVRLGDQVDWGGKLAFELALRERSRERVSARQAGKGFLGPLFEPVNVRPPAPLVPNSEPIPLDVDDVAAVLEPGGAFSRHFPQFEYRSEQVEMLRSVTEALSKGTHLMIEAGTGTGKSVAYLLPAALFALQNNLRVVISTNTINLQEQLMKKDIPDICEALNLPVRATVLKGRSNYLCPRKLENLRRLRPEREDEVRIIAKVLVWLSQGGTGDRQELNLNQPAERAVWERLSAADDACTGEMCMERMGGRCPFFQARQAAQSSHLIVVNHALLLADVATGNRVLPDYSYLIVDEAHHLENAVTSALSFQVTQAEIERSLRELGSLETGVMGTFLETAEEVLPPGKLGELNRLVQHATEQAFLFQNLSREFFAALDNFLVEMREGRDIGSYGQEVRILPSTRTLPSWLQVEMAWEDGERALDGLIGVMEKLTNTASELVQAGMEEMEDIFSSISNLYRRLEELKTNITGLVFEPDLDRVYWVEIQPTARRMSLQSAPLHIGPLVEKHIWHEKACVILTSATLRTYGDFDYMRNRLYAGEADAIALGSPFDYENQALVYLVNNIPEPVDKVGHQRAVEQGLVQLCKATGGRTLVLFTSYAQLQTTSRAIAPALMEAGIIVYEQGTGASAHSLLENFKASDQAVLLGTRAFWEGVDVPGEALSVLVIVKLPFAVPTDPIVAARSETFEDPFNEYSLPEAILTFRQGFGRLIRTATDRGVVVILDRRVLSKRYGRAFLEALPACTVRTGSLQDLPAVTSQWLNL